MKKYGIIAIVLLLIAASGIGAAHQTINKLKDDVTVTETVLTGDKSAASGISVTTASRLQWSPLFWSTTYTIREEPQLNCEFRFKQNEHTILDEGWEVDFYISPDGGEWWEEATFEDDSITTDLPKACTDTIIAKTEAGSSYEETIALQDYISQYQVHLDAHITDEKGFSLGFPDADLADQYFNIPVTKESLWNIAVTKNKKDNVKTLEITPLCPSEVYYTGVVDQEAVYFFLTDMVAYPQDDPHRSDIRLNLPKNMCGLHRIPVQVEKSDDGYHELVPDYTKAELVYPIEQGVRIFKPFLSEDGQELIFIMQETESIYLVVMDKETFTIKQKVYLRSNDYYVEDEYETMVKEEGDHMLVVYPDDKFSFLYKDKKGAYQLELTDKLLQSSDLDFFVIKKYIQAAFDGSRLVLACLTSNDDFETGSSYQLSIYQDAKLIYAGHYENNLDDIDAISDYDGSNAAATDSPITLSVPSAP